MTTKHNRPALTLSVVLAALTAAGLATTIPASAQASNPDATVRSAAGAGADDVKGAVEQFRADLGGGSVAAANGSFGGVRREINWDGVPDQFSAPNDFPSDFFNTRSPRGAVFSTPGLSFMVSSKAVTNVPVRFGNINPIYVRDFSAFSAERLFTPISSTITDVAFFIPGTKIPAVVTGFGAIFTDVDNPESSSIALYDANNTLIKRYTVAASAGNGTQSFLGVSLPGPARIARVRIESGQQTLADGTEDSAQRSRDKVALDDFIYTEPVVIPSPTTGLTTGPTTGTASTPAEAATVTTVVTSTAKPVLVLSPTTTVAKPNKRRATTTSRR